MDERRAVEGGVQTALADRPSNERWAFSVSEVPHADRYVVQLTRDDSEVGPGLELHPSELHHRGPALPHLQNVSQAVQDDVRLYIRANLRDSV